MTSESKEQLLVELALTSTDLFVKVNAVLEPDRFNKPLDRVVKFAKAYFEKYHAIPSFETIRVETDVELSPQDMEMDDFKYAVDEIELHCRESAMRNNILLAAEELNESVDENREPDFGKIEKMIRDAVSVSVDKDLGLNFFADPAKRLNDMLQNIDERAIGYPSLDRMMDNVRRGELILFAGGSGAGKSVVLANLARMMAKQKLNTLIISLELGSDLIAKRLDSIISGIPTKEVFDRISDLENLYQSILEQYGSLQIKKMPAKSSTNDIRSYLMEYNLQFGFYPDVVVVDYLDIMGPNVKTKGANRFDTDKDASEELRDLMIEINAFCFTASQLNRDAIDSKEKKQSHIGGGLSKIQTSDACIAIKRTEENIDDGTVCFQPIKLRNAEMRVGDVELFWNSKTLEITDKATPSAPGTKTHKKAEPSESAKKRLNDIISKTRR